jgi:hypothetical protein
VVYEPWPAPTLKTPFTKIYITDNLVTYYGIGPYFNSLDNLNISVTSSPYGAAWSSGDILYIQGNRRGTTYTVGFQVYDSYGQTTAIATIPVSEYGSLVAASFNNIALGWGYSGSSGWNCTKGGVLDYNWGNGESPKFVDYDTNEPTFKYYVQFGTGSTIAIKTNKIYFGGYVNYKFSYWLRAVDAADRCNFTSSCVFYKSNGTVIETLGANSYSSNTTWTPMWMTSVNDMSQVSYAIITLTGYDTLGWAGYYGMRFANVMIDGV